MSSDAKLGAHRRHGFYGRDPQSGVDQLPGEDAGSRTQLYDVRSRIGAEAIDQAVDRFPGIPGPGQVICRRRPAVAVQSDLVHGPSRWGLGSILTANTLDDVAVRLIIADSARKHGVSDEGFTLVIGANRSALVLEIGVIDGTTAPVVVHAMRARDRFLR